MENAADTAGLFDATVPAPSSPTFDNKKKKDAKPHERRTMLKPYDSVSSQLLEPHGKSLLPMMTLPDLWKMTAAGNYKAKFHSLLCADQSDDPWRVGAGVSRTAGAVKQGILGLQNPNVKAVIKDDLYSKAIKEANDLMPHLNILDFGKGSAKGKESSTTFASFKKFKGADGTASARPPIDRSENNIKEAAKKFYQWLKREKSPLRGLLSILGNGGEFYTSFVAEKVGRAAIHHKPMTEIEWQEAVLARSKTSEEEKELQQGKEHEGLLG